MSAYIQSLFGDLPGGWRGVFPVSEKIGPCQEMQDVTVWGMSLRWSGSLR